jgi:predicted phosphodiesterase
VIDVVRIVCISDTHEQHRRIEVPDGDVLVHAGDITYHGDPAAIADFDAWLGTLPHPHKIVIAGNHDFAFERDPGAAALLAHAHYLQDGGIELAGLRFWGSPWQPRFFDWAFNLDRGPALAAVWAKIPEGTDVLVVHGPPHGILDRTHAGVSAGCEELERRLREMVHPPKLVVFGHIHEGYGIETRGATTYVNASSCTRRYAPTNPPIVVVTGLSRTER